jgi:hypothetical protein
MKQDLILKLKKAIGMRKLLFSLFASFVLIGITNAQTGADLIKAAKKAVDGIGEKKEKLAAAEKAVDDAVKSPDNASSWEAWFHKGRFYNAMSGMDNSERLKAQITQKAVKAEYPKSAMMAVEAFANAIKNIPTTDKKAGKEVIKALAEAQGMLNVYGQELYNAQDIEGAYQNFKSSLTAHDLLKANGGKSTLDKEADYIGQLRTVGQLANYLKKPMDAVPYFKKLIDIKADTAFVYEGLYAAYIDKDEATAIKYLEEGRQKYPDETSLLFNEINLYLRKGKLDVLIDKLKQGIAKEPSNASLYFTLGNVYDNLGQQEKDAAKAAEYDAEAVKYYNKTLELDSKNVDAIYSIGAGYYNKAAKFSQELKKLESDFSKEGQKKYNEIEKKMQDEFDKALPYFQKAEGFNPNDQNTLIALKEIYARKNDLNMSKEFKTRLENVQGGSKNDKSYFAKQ